MFPLEIWMHIGLCDPRAWWALVRAIPCLGRYSLTMQSFLEDYFFHVLTSEPTTYMPARGPVKGTTIFAIPSYYGDGLHQPSVTDLRNRALQWVPPTSNYYARYRVGPYNTLHGFFFYTDGQRVHHYYFQHNLLHGPHRWYDHQGILLGEECYADGLLSGPYREYRPPPLRHDMWSDCHYLVDHPEALSNQPASHGKIEVSLNFVNGLADGPYYRYNGVPFVFDQGLFHGRVGTNALANNNLQTSVWLLCSKHICPPLDFLPLQSLVQFTTTYLNAARAIKKFRPYHSLMVNFVTGKIHGLLEYGSSRFHMTMQFSNGTPIGRHMFTGYGFTSDTYYHPQGYRQFLYEEEQLSFVVDVLTEISYTIYHYTSQHIIHTVVDIHPDKYFVHPPITLPRHTICGRAPAVGLLTTQY